MYYRPQKEVSQRQLYTKQLLKTKHLSILDHNFSHGSSMEMHNMEIHMLLLIFLLLYTYSINQNQLFSVFNEYQVAYSKVSHLDALFCYDEDIASHPIFVKSSDKLPFHFVFLIYSKLTF